LAVKPYWLRLNAVIAPSRSRDRARGDGDRARRRLLRGEPVLEIPFVEGDHAEAHHGVRVAAVLGALAPEIAGLVRLQQRWLPRFGIHVDLAGELGHPERMDDVDRAELQADGPAGGMTSSFAVERGPTPVDLLFG